jgi:hypothetical protein
MVSSTGRINLTSIISHSLIYVMDYLPIIHGRSPSCCFDHYDPAESLGDCLMKLVWHVQKNDPQDSAEVAGNRKYDVYMGIDVFGRNTFGGGQWKVGVLTFVFIQLRMFIITN